MHALRILALVLLIVGGLNWALVGLANFNLVEALFGTASRLVYAVVGLAALYEAAMLATNGRGAGLMDRT